MGSSNCCNVGATREVLKRIGVGQALALANSLTGVATTYLVNNNASYPMLQSITAYLFIFAVYFPAYLFLRYKFRGTKFANYRFLDRWYKYAVLALIDMEANFVVVLAYQYTNMMSAQLLGCFTVPCVLVLSFFVLKMKFALTHIIGCMIAIGGLVLLIVLDADGLSRTGGGSNEVLGDLFCLLSSALYASSNVLTEWFIKPSKANALIASRDVIVRGGGVADANAGQNGEEAELRDLDAVEDRPQVPVYVPVVENLAMMSLFALCFATVQFFAVEWRTFEPLRGEWTGQDWLFQMMFGLTMLCVYTGFPIIFIISSAAFANISLLAVNVYSIIWNVAFFNIYPTPMFFVSYVLIVLGVLLYNLTDIFRFPFLARINYPCGDPFAEKLADEASPETHLEEELARQEEVPRPVEDLLPVNDGDEPTKPEKGELTEEPKDENEFAAENLRERRE